jgi:hypothetical protein
MSSPGVWLYSDLSFGNALGKGMYCDPGSTKLVLILSLIHLERAIWYQNWARTRHYRLRENWESVRPLSCRYRLINET